MIRFETEVDIAAPADRTWAAVSNVGEWPSWTPSIRSVAPVASPGLARGAGFKVRQPGMPPMTWTVTDLEAGSSFAWATASPGIQTIAWHRVEPMGEGRSRLSLAVEHSGLLARPVAWLMGRRTRRFLALEAQGMKAFAEALAGAKAS